MVNAMEWLYSQEEYNTKKKRRRVDWLLIDKKELEGHLDLREFVNLGWLHCPDNKITSIDLSKNIYLTKLDCSDNKLTSIDVSNRVNLTKLDCCYNKLTSIDFLNQLPNPEKLEELKLDNNNIARTNLEFLRPFVNLDSKLSLGTDNPDRYNNNIYNRFYGSLEPLRNMTKLPGLCIDGTDVEEGLEYLPTSIKKNSSYGFNCSPKLPNQKVEKIQNELRPFDYDLEAWQLAHPEKMLIARPEYFTNPDSREKWIQALANKIIQSQQELQETKTNLPEKVKRIERLESKINHLKIIKNLLEELAIERDHSQDINNWYQRQLGGENAQKRNDLWNLILELKWNSKQQEQENQQLKENIKVGNKILEQEYQPKQTKEQGTQTDLTSQDYERQQKENQELQERIRKLTLKKIE